MSVKTQMLAAKQLIQNGRYTEACAILLTINHPTADKWLEKLDEMEFDDDFPIQRKSKSSNSSNTTVYIQQKPDYTTSAVLVLVLYFLLYIPGLIANVAFWFKAQADKREYGEAPSGAGCLTILLVIFVIFPLACGILVVLLGVMGDSVNDTFMSITKDLEAGIR